MDRTPYVFVRLSALLLSQLRGPSYRVSTDYPSFMSIQASNDPDRPAPVTVLDPFCGDARLRIAAKKATVDAAAALRKKEREAAAWREKKGLPPLDANNPSTGHQEFSWWIMGGVLMALVLVMLVLGLGIAWVVLQVGVFFSLFFSFSCRVGCGD